MSAGLSPFPASALLRRAQAAWAMLAARERRLLAVAMVVVMLAVLWWVGVNPALRTVRSAESQHQALDAELQTMRTLAAEAARLQALPRIGADDSRKALELSVRQGLGASAQISVAGERATVTLKGASAETLVLWLAQARSNARVAPVAARLTLNTARTGWDGSVVLALPPP
ncbi:MAG: type II secretion system protein GspM [Polaromonas sp.]|nr:type II secretion system protein GspM [Polaromonas sp.]